MILKKLISDDSIVIKNKKIICYEKSQAYLQELNEKFSITKNNIVIVDDFKRNQGYLYLNGTKINIVGSQYFNTADLTETILIITSDYFEEAYEKLCNLKQVVEKFNIIYFFANEETEIELKYKKEYAEKNLENIIVFRSGPHNFSYIKGMDFSDNARALFEYMLTEKYNEKYELVWFVKNPQEFSAYKKYKNVKFLSFDWNISEDIQKREEYYRVLFLAKYFFFTDAYGFVRNCRTDQIRVQLWHGCGFKTRVNFVRCEKRYEYTTVISELYAHIHEEIYGLREEQVLVTGYAKQDWLLHPISKDKLIELGIPVNKRYIFWLPTFRTTQKALVQLNEQQIISKTGLPILYSQSALEQLDELLVLYDMVLLIKLHPFQDRNMIHCNSLNNIILLENEQLLKADIQINQLLGWAEALISDYSSVAVDYLLLNRPMAFTLDDVEEYELSRGFVFENIKDWLPGVEIYHQEDFIDFIKNIALGIDSSVQKRKEIREKMYQYFDDKNCYRIVKKIIEGSK